MIRRIWGVTGDGVIPTVATEAIDQDISANGGSLVDILTGFAATNYRIEQTYTDLDRLDWVERLEEFGKPPGVAGEKALSGTTGGTSADSHRLRDGGAVYVEFVADEATTGASTLTVEPDLSRVIEAQVFRMVEYPDPCGDPAGGVVTSPVHGGGFAGRIESCTSAVVGMEQRVDVDQWSYASVWMALDAGSRVPAQVI